VTTVILKVTQRPASLLVPAFTDQRKSSTMFFTHMSASDNFRTEPRDRYGSHQWTDVIVDDHLTPWNGRAIRKAYRNMRQAGMSTNDVRGILWDLAIASGARTCYHDVM
jgi:hypothetical protein